MRNAKHLGAVAALVFVIAASAAAGAAVSGWSIKGAGGGAASLSCPGGLTRLGHVFGPNMTLFAFDPAVRVENEYTVAEDFFLVEDVDTGAHAGTHLDVPAHFIEMGRTVDRLAADEFIWPAYKIDVREMTFDGEIPFVEIADIRAYERRHGRIPKGALVVLQTGAEEFWGAEVVAQDEDDNVANTDDFFDFPNAGFSGEAVQWLFDRRKIDGVGSDAYGPDAAGDDSFSATFTALLNDGVALVALANLDAVNVRGDLIIAPTVALEGGSGFTTDPRACHARGRRGRH